MVPVSTGSENLPLFTHLFSEHSTKQGISTVSNDHLSKEEVKNKGLLIPQGSTGNVC